MYTNNKASWNSQRTKTSPGMASRTMEEQEQDFTILRQNFAISQQNKNYFFNFI